MSSAGSQITSDFSTGEEKRRYATRSLFENDTVSSLKTPERECIQGFVTNFEQSR